MKITLKEDGNKIVTEFINGASDLSEEDMERYLKDFIQLINQEVIGILA